MTKKGTIGSAFGDWLKTEGIEGEACVQIIDELLSQRGGMHEAPAAPGIYAVIASSTDLLPGVALGQDLIAYVGISRNLAQRNHLRHKNSGFSTLRRSIGALLADDLKLVAIPRSASRSKQNLGFYRFDEVSEARLSEWMNKHLTIAAIAVKPPLNKLEKEIIQMLEPPLNLTGWKNPEKPRISALRKECCRQAHGLT